MALEDQPPPSGHDYGSWTDAQVHEELYWTLKAALERSRRHGLSAVALSLAVLPPRQRLAHLATLQAYMGAADALDVDLEADYLAAHPLPPGAQAELERRRPREQAPR